MNITALAGKAEEAGADAEAKLREVFATLKKSGVKITITPEGRESMRKHCPTLLAELEGLEDG
jgi:hypothetical protein